MADDHSLRPTDLAALVGSRLCHDLISPLGAIGNGVELLAMSGGGGASPELQLIAESVTNANARLKFFRVALGQAGAEQRLGQPEIVAILADLARGGRHSYDWQAPGDQPRREVKSVFLALLCLEAALPWGGTVTFAHTNGDWFVHATAPRTKPDPGLWARLDGAAGAALAPAQVQFALLPLELASLGRRVAWEISETGATIRF